MIQDIAPKVFHNEYREEIPKGGDTALFYRGKYTLLKKGSEGDIVFPKVSDFTAPGTVFTYLFRIDEEKYFLVETRGSLVPDGLKGAGYTLERQWLFRSAVPRDRAFAAVTGLQMADWYRSRRFCGECGTRLTKDHKERMMRCPECGRLYYPVICPGVIVAVVHNGRLLMSKYAHGEYRRFALIAGFNESGESIEDTVHREVMEEVGLRVKNLRFYKSQPWPFSDTLLMGFFCELDGDDETITLQKEELSEAGWYTPDEVPEDFEHASLTSEMMTVFRKQGGHVQEPENE